MSEKRNLTTKETFALAFCFDLYPNSVFNNGSIFVMNVDPLIKKAIEFSRIKIIKFFFRSQNQFFFGTTVKHLKKEKKLMVSFLVTYNYFWDQKYTLFIEEKDMKFYLKHQTQIQKQTIKFMS